MFKLFRHREETLPPDDLFGDLPRGVEGRLRIESRLPRARFATRQEVLQHRFKDRSGDIFLGVVDGVTRAYERPDGRIEYRTAGGVLIGMRDDRHMFTCAATRTGKGRGVIIPNLLCYGGSCLCIDPKGENANRTAGWRHAGLGQQVKILDPFGVTEARLSAFRASFNFLAGLTLDNPTIVEDAGLIADALVVADSKESHWTETARDFIEGVILHVVTSPDFAADERHLPTVADLISGRRMELADLLTEMISNSCLSGRIVAAARALSEKHDAEQAGVVSTARRNLRFLNYDAIRNACSRHDFNLEDLKRQQMTVYLCLPALRMESCARWLRLFVNLTLGAMERVPTPPPTPVLMLLDEFPVLQHMKELETAAGLLAGLGVKLWPISQDLTQLKQLYEKRWETFLGNSGVLQFFGPADATTLDWISKRLGQTTLTVVNQGALSHEQRNAHGASGRGEQQQTVSLLTPEEVSRYFGRNDRYCRQLVIVPGERPFVLQRAYYDHHEAFAGRFYSDQGKP